MVRLRSMAPTYSAFFTYGKSITSKVHTHTERETPHIKCFINVKSGKSTMTCIISVDSSCSFFHFALSSFLSSMLFMCVCVCLFSTALSSLSCHMPMRPNSLPLRNNNSFLLVYSMNARKEHREFRLLAVLPLSIHLYFFVHCAQQ